MSSDEQSDKECPLCMEAFDIDDFNFYPCNCQYQICRFCWHRIRTNENGLCPACRQSYPEDPVNFQPFSSAELQKIKSEKKQKIQQQKNKVVESRKHLSEFRVLQKNLVYAVGLSQRMADPELLKKPEFFGKFGRIIKVAVGTAQAINNSTPPTHTSYVTYARSEDALRAIQAVNNMVVDGRLLKASLGTTKYCSNFLKGQACYKPECMYLHEVAEEETSFTKEDMHQGKHTEYERRLHDQMMAVLGQQSNSAAGTQQQKEMLKNKTNRIAENFNEKKRQATGSTENLVKTAQQKQKKGSAGNIGVSTAATTSGSTKCGWDEQKMSGTATTTTRGGSETRELRRNESAQAMVSDVKRNSKASVKSVSPPTISSAGLEDRSANSSSNNIAALNTSPISMQYSMADQPHQQQQQLVRSESNPPLMAASSVPSPSPPMMIPTAEMNGIGDEDTTLVMVAAAATESNSMQLDIVQEPEEKTLPPKSANSTINFFLDQDDGDLGFDPFAESARELEKIMEEEKQNMPSAADASSLTSHQHNGFGSASSASINNYFSNNNNSTLFNHNHQPHPPGLHPAFSGNGGLHSNNFDGGDGPSGFSSMFGSNKMMNSSERSIANSMSDLRESFKAMLPNVNVRFMSDSNSQLQQQQQPLTHQSHQHHNFGGFFDNSSTSSLPALPSGGQMRTAASNHFRQFGLEHPQQQQPHPSLFQQRIHHLQQQQQIQTQNHNHMAQNHHHPFQSMGSYGNGSNNTNGPFSGGMQQQQHQMAHQQQQSQPSQQSQYSQQQSTATAAALHRQQTSSSNHTHPFQSLQQQHFAMPPLQQQQQQHNSGGAGPFGSQSIEQQQQTGSGGGGSSWLPVPPGFSPR